MTINIDINDKEINLNTLISKLNFTNLINNNNNCSIKKKYINLSYNNLINLLACESNNYLIIKFTADWCCPCRKIKDYVNSLFSQMPNNVYLFEINIDEDSEIFFELKKKRMVKTIPAFLIYNLNKKRNNWFEADLNFSSSNKNTIFEYLKPIYENKN